MAKHRPSTTTVEPMTIPEIIAHLRSIGAPLAASLESTYERVKATKTDAEIAVVEQQLRDAFGLLNAKLKEQGLA